MTYDPVNFADEFDREYGLTKIDLDKRARAATDVTARAAAISELTERIVGDLWSLLADLEATASDEVVRQDVRQAAASLGALLLELYGTAARLGLGKVIYSVVARLHQARMSSFDAAGFAPADLDDLVALTE